VGGGTSPVHEFDDFLIEIGTDDPESFVHFLLAGDPPVVARKDKGRVLISLRSVFPKEEAVVIRRVREACQCMS